MWNEPMPKWRTARKQYQCQGDSCAKVMAPGERYFDRALRHPTHSHLDTVRSAPSPLSKGPRVITSSMVAMIFLIAITNTFPARNGSF
jgi:hypothetical protein